jgi:eukaryotic-like serine/threonine-protein kinase
MLDFLGFRDDLRRADMKQDPHVGPNPSEARVIHFGPIEVDVRAAELRNHGLKTRLHNQSFQILLMLLERPGDVVLREEIRKKLWPNDTIVEFDHSINAAVQKLREALGEAADEPRYVETVARRGYRFIGTIEAVLDDPLRELQPQQDPSNGESPALETGDLARPRASGGRKEWPTRSRKVAMTIAGAVLLAGAVLAFMYLRKTLQPPSIVRYSVPLPPNTRFTDYQYPVVGYPVVSPNGERIALPLAPLIGDRTQIWIYQMSTGEFRPIAGTDGAFEISWSHDGGSLVFWANQKYNRLDLSSGAISTVVKDPHYGRPTIAPNGSMLVSTQLGLELVATNGRRRLVASRMPNDTFDYYPALLPDGNRFLFLRGIFLPAEIWKGNLDSSAPVHLFSADSQVEYADSGHLLFMKGDTLFAQSFDSKNAVVLGPAQSLVNGVARLVSSSLAGFSVSRNGVLAFRPGAATTTTRLTWLDRNGRELGTLGEAADYSSPAFSPDDKHLAVAMRDLRTGKRDIWVFDLVRGANSRLTFDPTDHTNPTWSPDGARIAFTSDRKGMRDLYITSASGGSEDEVLLESKAHKSVTDWSSDGQFLLYNQIENQLVLNAKPSATSEHKEAIYVLPLSGADRRPIAFLATPFREDRARMSPDGRWIAYGSNESGRIDVYVQPFPANGKKYKISTAGGEEPQWRGDGKELFYVAGSTVMAAEVHTKGVELVFGIPKKLFDAHLTDVRSRSRLAITKDGQKFLALEPVGEDPRAPFTVILNWQRLLDKR